MTVCANNIFQSFNIWDQLSTKNLQMHISCATTRKVHKNENGGPSKLKIHNPVHKHHWNNG